MEEAIKPSSTPRCDCRAAWESGTGSHTPQTRRVEDRKYKNIPEPELANGDHQPDGIHHLNVSRWQQRALKHTQLHTDIHALVCLTGQPGCAGTCTTRTGSRFRRWSSRVRNIRTIFLCTNVSSLENGDRSRTVYPSGASFVHTRRLKLYAHKSNECHQVWARGFLFVVIYGQNHAALTHALTVSPLHTQTTPATKLRPAAQSFPRCRAECCASEKHQ